MGRKHSIGIGEVSDILSHLAFSKPNGAPTTDADARAGACGAQCGSIDGM